MSLLPCKVSRLITTTVEQINNIQITSYPHKWTGECKNSRGYDSIYTSTEIRVVNVGHDCARPHKTNKNKPASYRAARTPISRTEWITCTILGFICCELSVRFEICLAYNCQGIETVLQMEIVITL